MKYAGFWLRVVAAIIDGILLQVAAYIVSFGIGAQPMGGSGRSGAVMLLIGIAYYIFMEGSQYQGTLGKMALGIKVTDLNGKRISYGRATGRYFAKFLSAIILGIGYMMAGWTQKKQALHDMVAGTLVVRGKA